MDIKYNFIYLTEASFMNYFLAIHMMLRFFHSLLFKLGNILIFEQV